MSVELIELGSAYAETRGVDTSGFSDSDINKFPQDGVYFDTSDEDLLI